MEGFGELNEFRSTFSIGNRAQNETQIVSCTAGKFIKGGDSTAIALTAKGVIKTGKLGGMIGVRRGDVVVGADVKKQPSQDVIHGDAAEEELGLACLVSSYTLPHQNSQPGGRGWQTACSKVLSRHTRDT